MAVNYDKNGTDIDTLLAPRTTGWAQAANTGYIFQGNDLAALFAIAAAGTAYSGGALGFGNPSDIGATFAGIGTTTVVIATQPVAVSGANFSNSTQTITSNAASALGSKGKGSYTYTWTIATGSGITFTSQGSASTTLSASVASNASNTGTFFCAVSDGTTTTNTNTVAWTLSNFSLVGFTFSPAVPAGTAAPGTGVTASSIATPTINIIPTGGSGGGNNANYTYTWSITVISGNGTLTVNGVNGAAGSFSAFVTSNTVAPTVTMNGTITCVVADVNFPANNISHTTSWSNHNTSSAFLSHTDTFRGAFNTTTLGTSTLTVTVPTGATHCVVSVSGPGGGGGAPLSPTAGFGGGGGAAAYVKTNSISVVAGEIFAISSGFRGIGGNLSSTGEGEHNNTQAVVNGATTVNVVLDVTNTAAAGKQGGGTSNTTPATFQPTLVQGLSNPFGNLSGFSVSVPGAGGGAGTSGGAGGTAGAAPTLVGFTAVTSTAGIAGLAGSGVTGGNGGGATGTTGKGYTTAGSIFDSQADGQTNTAAGTGGTTGGSGGGGSGNTGGPPGGSGNGWAGIGGESFIAFTWT